jgi:hypothetical protein
MGDDELLLRFAELERAVRDRDALERRLRDGGGDADLRELSLAACERVLSRRTGLYRCLIRQGWTPPAAVVRHLVEDEDLLGQSLGDAGG